MSQIITNTNADKAFTTKELAFTAICSALLAVCSWISVPTTVPFTFQTFAVFCTLELLGGKKGFFAILVYLLLGAVGIPVFAGFSGGMGAILGMTGGYLVGFLLTAGIYWISEKISLHQYLWFRIIILILGLSVCYLFGTIWFMLIYTRDITTISFAEALGMCVTPFLIPDMLKLALAVLLSVRIKKYVNI